MLAPTLAVHTCLGGGGGGEGRHTAACPLRRFSPDARDTVCFVDDPDLAFVMQRYREVHDFMHALTGLQPSVVDELTLKWYEMAQTGLPMCALAAFVGPARLPPSQLRFLATQGIPWAAKHGATTPFYLNTYFERRFGDSADAVRAAAGVTLAPSFPSP